ncbi:SIR2 family NAD-dependent protein deacylase [Natronolimnohabitans innermongolicus]|uniref:Silent information regulator protein Sir2 n=1 Tax=Natronolimnohabitans innermongolicus JCM 12255 TaxID=1227499 RepID=L9WKQ7_9EURY|nr:Sir2 family NAD-dependent protein deacetylase [Natronolimnohabitans innermongolicus]ELY50065.1 silent information regulator protein Sir2 [Natronolimnohabitans innermongolicus JCM 12255]
MDDLESFADEIRSAETVVAFTGAGISAPSGVPTFRGDDGVWEKFDEGQFTYGRFQRDPEAFWDDRVGLQREMFDGTYEPNAAHEALAELGRTDHLEAILTQNTDGLHGDAVDAVVGADDPEPAILELHGNSQRVRCTGCGTRRDGDPIFERAANGDLPPTCDCGGVYKPDVVLFGEQLPGAVIQRARTLARESDVFIAIGSSLVVQPAASLPRQAASSGATVAIVNLESTPVDGAADVIRREDVTDVLPQLVELVTDSA